MPLPDRRTRSSSGALERSTNDVDDCVTAAGRRRMFWYLIGKRGHAHMEPDNPYSPPAVPHTTDCVAEPFRHRRRHAWYFLGMSVVASTTYTYFDEVVLGTSYGAWPMLITTATISVACAWFTRNSLVSPFCCFAGTMAGDILAGLIRGWQYAQLHFCIPLSIAFSNSISAAS